MSTSSAKIPRIPKYISLADHLRIQVQTGKLKPGEQLPTVSELRSEHQVSCSTIEKVYAILEKEGLIIREQGRGVFVSRISGTKRPTTGIIGFIGYGFLEEVNNSQFWTSLLRGIQDAASRHKIQLMLLNDGMDSNVWNKIDGLLLSEAEEEIELHLALIPLGMPCISLITPSTKTTSIIFDDFQGARDATNNLIALGHKNIAYLIDLDNNNETLKRRVAGYKAALREAGIEADETAIKPLRKAYWYDGSKIDYRGGARRCVQDWLADNGKVLKYTAVLAQNDQAALGIVEELTVSGIRVPEDVSVVGFDGIEIPENGLPRLSTVEIPLEKIGASAVRLLSKQVKAREGGTPPWIETIVLTSHYRQGATTAPIKK